MSRNRMIDADAAMAGAVTRVLAMAPGGSEPQTQAVSVHPIPIMYCHVASPRIWRVGAPVCSVVVDGPSIGATENFPRADGPMTVRIGRDAVFASNSETENGRVDRASESMGISVALRGRRAWKAAPSQCVGRCSTNGFTPDGKPKLKEEIPKRESLVPGSPSARTACTMMSPVTPGSPIGRIPESSWTHEATTLSFQLKAVSDN
jgi:hypothetical protein